MVCPSFFRRSSVIADTRLPTKTVWIGEAAASSITMFTTDPDLIWSATALGVSASEMTVSVLPSFLGSSWAAATRPPSSRAATHVDHFMGYLRVSKRRVGNETPALHGSRAIRGVRDP